MYVRRRHGSFCLVFLFLWRQSGILYFAYWSLAWALQVVALLSVGLYFSTSRLFWLGPYALFEFAFALALLVAARSGPSRATYTWKSALRLLLGFPLFLAIVYLLGLQSSFEGFQAVHGADPWQHLSLQLLRDPRQRGRGWPALPFFAALPVHRFSAQRCRVLLSL